jgi:hypothetical protein
MKLARKSVEVRHDLAFLRENDKLIGIHVGDVKMAMRCVETLIIEAHCVTWPRHVHNLLHDPTSAAF